MNESIPYGRQDISTDDIQAVVEVLQSDWLTQGATVPRFEQSVTNHCNVQHAVAVNSGTSALHIACLALGLGKGDCLWTVPNTFVASANCALYCNATVDFVDIDPKTYNMSVEQLEKKLITAEKNNCLPKIVIPVHFSGQSCDMSAIYALADRYGFSTIEDASHAIGGAYLNKPIGSCSYSDITIFSFHPVKIITTGEGGLATTNNPLLAKRMRLLRTHGITADNHDMELRPSNEIWNYQQIFLGFNYRMTDIHAALGLSQMDRLDEFVTKRHVIARRYDEAMVRLPVIVPWQSIDCYSSYHLYVIRIDSNMRRSVYEALRKEKIFVNIHYIPLYRHPYYKNMGFEDGYCDEAEKFYLETLSLPMYAGLTERQQIRVLNVLEKSLS